MAIGGVYTIPHVYRNWGKCVLFVALCEERPITDYIQNIYVSNHTPGDRKQDHPYVAKMGSGRIGGGGVMWRTG